MTYDAGRARGRGWRGRRGDRPHQAAVGRRPGAARRRGADRTEIRADATDLAFVEITLVDEPPDGLRPRADRRVTVTSTGPGVLQGLGSANPITEESFLDADCTTFDGRALAVVRPTGPGTITVTATAEGCPPQQVSIASR